MMRTKRFVILLILIFPNRLLAQRIVVTPSDNIETAINNLNPGDTLLFSPGIYSGRFDISVNGTNDSPIVLMSLSSNISEFAVIDGGASNPGLELSNRWIDFFPPKILHGLK